MQTCSPGPSRPARTPFSHLSPCLSPAGNPQIWRGFCCHTKLLCITRRVECSEATSAAPSFCCQCLCPLSSVLCPLSRVLCIFVFVFVSALDCKCGGCCCCVFFNFLHNFHFILVRFLTARRRCYQYLSSSSAALTLLATGFGFGFGISCFCPFATEAAKCFCNNIFPEISYHLSGLTTNLSF